MNRGELRGVNIERSLWREKLWASTKAERSEA
jgi:hypothetical protein